MVAMADVLEVAAEAAVQVMETLTAVAKILQTLQVAVEKELSEVAAVAKVGELIKVVMEKVAAMEAAQAALVVALEEAQAAVAAPVLQPRAPALADLKARVLDAIEAEALVVEALTALKRALVEEVAPTVKVSELGARTTRVRGPAGLGAPLGCGARAASPPDLLPWRRHSFFFFLSGRSRDPCFHFSAQIKTSLCQTLCPVSDVLTGLLCLEGGAHFFLRKHTLFFVKQGGT